MIFDEYEMILIGIGEEFDDNEEALAAYRNLCGKLEGKNYFIVSLCMDDSIFESGLKEDRIVAPLGGKRYKQCPDACTHDLYDISESQCPICGKELVFNNIEAENYVEEGYLPMWEKHKKWLSGTLNHRLLIVELGVSLKFPQVIRWPFERITLINEKSKMIRVNKTVPQINAEISQRAEAVRQSSVEWATLL